METAAVEVREMVKRYGTDTAVAGMSFTAPRGAVTALLGPNGAGKTTTIETCEGFRRADEGTVRVLGLDPIADGRSLKPRVGVMPQNGGVPTSARAGEWLRLMAAFHARPIPPDALLERLGLRSVAHTPFRRLSGGQQQRLSLAAAVIGRPELVFLDEPTAGLDPQARSATWRLITELRAAGVAVMLTTHYMEEAERLADQVVIVDHGRVVARGTPEELTTTSRELRFCARPAPEAAELARALPPGASVAESPEGGYVITAADPAGVGPELIAALTSWCAQRGILTTELKVRHRSLEDVFLELTGHDIREP